MPPEEKDVPHWARMAVKEMREKHKLPKRVTDRMVYARMLIAPARILNKRVKSLVQETSC